VWKILLFEDRLVSPLRRDSFNEVNFKGIGNTLIKALSIPFSLELMRISGARVTRSSAQCLFSKLWPQVPLGKDAIIPLMSEVLIDLTTNNR